METLLEQRKEVRSTLSWPVSIWLPQANSFFNGRSTNISKTGVFLSVPITTPVKAGHIVEINFPRTNAVTELGSNLATAPAMMIESLSSPRTSDLLGFRKANATATNSARATPPKISQRILKKDLLVGPVSDLFSLVFVGIIIFCYS